MSGVKKHSKLIFLWLFVLPYLFTTTNMFVKSESLSYKHGNFYYYRDLPLGNQEGDVLVEVRSTLCSKSALVDVIYNTEEEPAIFPPAKELRQCLPTEHGATFTMQTISTVEMFGLIPTFWPKDETWTCLVNVGKCIKR